MCAGPSGRLASNTQAGIRRACVRGRAQPTLHKTNATASRIKRCMSVIVGKPGFPSKKFAFWVEDRGIGGDSGTRARAAARYN
jgi:hypothetical protein